jgi:two-component system NarL family response regulator
MCAVAALPELTVIVADAEQSRRDQIVERLENERAITVLEATGDPSYAVDRILDSLPDVVIIDVKLPGQAALAACWTVLQEAPATQMILLAGPEDLEAVFQAITYGAAGCLQRAEAVDQCGMAVRGASRGEYLLPPLVASRVLHDVEAYAKAVDHPFGASSPLTATEREVLMSIAGGDTPADIARRHEVTARLVNLHTGYAVAKLQRHAERARALADFPRSA